MAFSTPQIAFSPADGGSGNDTITGTSGDDTLFGGAGHDRILSGAGTDTLFGGDGNDLLIAQGLAGIFEGGAGTDTAQFSGNRADYIVELGTYSIPHLTLSDSAGNKYCLLNMERVVFADETIEVDDLNGLPHLQITGNTIVGGLDAGQNHFVSFQLTNLRGAPTNGSNQPAVQIGVSVYLSINATLDANDVLFGKKTFFDVTSVETLNGQISGTLPSNFTTGTYHLIWVLDEDNLVDQTNEDANQHLVANVDINVDPTPETFLGSEQSDTHYGVAGTNRILGNGGHDTLYGNDGADTLNGGDGNDVIVGGLTSADLRDVVYAGAGNDSIDGGYGNDLIYGQDGNDTIAGGFGSDTLQGQGGNDVITGSALSDKVYGNDGDDFVNGGFGHDRIVGGSGADRFYHLGIKDHGSDWIQDFASSEGDTLIFGQSNATTSDFKVNIATTENAGEASIAEAFIVYKPTGKIIWALVDGAAQQQLMIQFSGDPDLFDLLL